LTEASAEEHFGLQILAKDTQATLQIEQIVTSPWTAFRKPVGAE